MFCRICGALLAPNAAFCGMCGTAVFQGSTEYTVYKYDREYARKNHTFISYGSLIARGLLYCMTPLLLLFFGESFVIAAMLLCFCGIALLITECCFKRKYFLARQSAIVFDKSEDIMYYVTLFGDVSMGVGTVSQALAAAQNFRNTAYQVQMAQMDQRMIQEVKQYRAGNNRYNIWTGGAVRIQEMNQPIPVKIKKRYTVYTYNNRNGKEKTIKIPDCFPKWKEQIV